MNDYVRTLSLAGDCTAVLATLANIQEHLQSEHVDEAMHHVRLVLDDLVLAL